MTKAASPFPDIAVFAVRFPHGIARNADILFGMSVLISGIGIGGPTLAYWLLVYGIKSTLVERASQLRTGGYAPDFWGLGLDVAGADGHPA